MVTVHSISLPLGRPRRQLYDKENSTYIDSSNKVSDKETSKHLLLQMDNELKVEELSKDEKIEEIVSRKSKTDFMENTQVSKVHEEFKTTNIVPLQYWNEMEKRIMRYLKGYAVEVTSIEEVEYKNLQQRRRNLSNMRLQDNSNEESKGGLQER